MLNRYFPLNRHVREHLIASDNLRSGSVKAET